MDALSFIHDYISRFLNYIYIIPTSKRAINGVGTTTVDTDQLNKTVIKPFDSLPGPKGWPVIGNFIEYLKPKNYGKLHELMVCKLSTSVISHVFFF